MRAIEGTDSRTICVETQKLNSEVHRANEDADHLEAEPALFSEGTVTGCVLHDVSDLAFQFFQELQMYRELLEKDIRRLGSSLETLQTEDQNTAGLFRNDSSGDERRAPGQNQTNHFTETGS